MVTTFTKRIPTWENPQKEISYAGTHYVADFWFAKIVEDEKELEELLMGAAKAAHSTPLKFTCYKFSPQGITGVLLLSESHIAIHTWPEIQYYAVDIFTCGKNSRPKEALEFFRKALNPKKVVMREIKRGKMQ